MYVQRCSPRTHLKLLVEQLLPLGLKLLHVSGELSHKDRPTRYAGVEVCLLQCLHLVRTLTLGQVRGVHILEVWGLDTRRFRGTLIQRHLSLLPFGDAQTYHDKEDD